MMYVVAKYCCIDEIINEEEKDSRLSGSDLLSSPHTPLASPNSEPLAPIDNKIVYLKL
jgi:hypothetical protein